MVDFYKPISASLPLREDGGSAIFFIEMEPSMKITKEEVFYVADLAHLEMGDTSIDRFADQIGRILDYVDTLNQADTTGVAATSHAISLTNAFREDQERPHLERERALSNAPEEEDGSFVVPKVVG
jgi:aspartyl-tRNA(Asn)/glutamyl-tRNA(Gln) amidotransferase subunit C